MSDLRKSSVFAAAMFALVIPTFAGADPLREPSDFGDDPDGAEIYVQLDEDVSEDTSDEGSEDVGSEDVGSKDVGSEDYASDEGGTDVSEEKTDDVTDGDTGAADDVADVVDAWVTTTGDGDGPIYQEFASGSGPMQREITPVPTTPADGNPAIISVAADRLDATLGINVHDKAAVAAQCAVLLEAGETYQAFYKLYCD